MARISGMILGIGLLVFISSLASPAVAWDHDDDDDDYKKRRWYAAPVVRYPLPRQPVYAPFRSVERHDHYRGGIAVPPPVPYQQAPLAPAPLPPSEIERELHHYQPAQIVAPPAPPLAVLPHERPGQFLNVPAPLYPYVRVKDRDNAPRFGLHQILAVRSPDPFRFPGCVYVKVCVPPGPCRNVKVKHGGAKVELDYGEFEVEITSSRGVVTIEYDD